MLATRERLIGNLYSGLDPAPDKEAALRLGSNGALSWLIDNGKLTVTEANGLVTDFPLTGTIGDLAKALAKTTIEVKYFNADVQHLSAGTLIDGSGLESESNGDLLSIFTSTLWAIMDAYAVELDAADNNIDEAIADLYINSATGEMLDIWGQYFADPRQIGEADSAYSQRIIVDTLRPKSNKYALINAAKAIFGSKIDIYEPWQDLFFLSESSLDNQRTYDGDMWSPYVFRPQLRAQQNINWNGITALFEKLRPAAVFQLPPEFIPDARGNQAGIKGLGIAQTEHVFSGAIYADKTNLDDYKLGDPIVNNYRISIYDIYAMGLYKLLPFSWANAQNQVVTPYNWAGPWDSKLWEKSVAVSNGWDSKVWNQLYPSIPTPIPTLPLALEARRSFVRADLVLSDMDEKLGDLRCRFTMKTVTSKNTPLLDDFTLSDFDNGYREVAEEDVYWPDYANGLSVDKAAGTLLSFPLTNDLSIGAAFAAQDWLSGGYILSDFQPVPNYKAVRTDTYSLGNYSSILIGWENPSTYRNPQFEWLGSWNTRLWSVLEKNGWDSRPWNDTYKKADKTIPALPLLLESKRSFVRADLVLSDMDEKLGDLRCRTTMKTVTSKNTPMLDDFTLSDFDNGYREVAEEDVYWPDYVNGAEVPSPSLGLTYSDNRAFSVGIFNSASEAWCYEGWGYYGDSTWGDIENSAVKSSINLLTQHWSGSWDKSTWDATILSGFYISEMVVTTHYLELNPTLGTEIHSWSGSWDSMLWGSSYSYSGICIKSTTESR